MCPAAALVMLAATAGAMRGVTPGLAGNRRALVRACHADPSTQSSAQPRSSSPLASAGAAAFSLEEENARLASRVVELEEMLERTQGLCEVLDDEGACSPEGCDPSDHEFTQALRARGSWLLGLLALQSCSSFVLVRNCCWRCT